MKKAVNSLLLVIGFILVSTTSASAKGIPIVYSNGPKCTMTTQLPDSVEIDGTHVNFGVKFDQFSIFWVPMWNYGTTEYVLLNDKKDTYYDLDKDDLAYLKETYQIETDKDPSIPFWDKIGGKFIWGGVLLFVIWGMLPSRKK